MNKLEEQKYEGMENSMEDKFLPMFSLTSGVGVEVLPDLYCYTNQIVNLCCVGNREKSNEWVLVDTGMPESTNRIIKVVKEREIW